MEAAPHTERSTAQHSTAQHSTAQHSTAQHSTAQHSKAAGDECETTARPARCSPGVVRFERALSNHRRGLCRRRKSCDRPSGRLYGHARPRLWRLAAGGRWPAGSAGDELACCSLQLCLLLTFPFRAACSVHASQYGQVILWLAAVVCDWTGHAGRRLDVNALPGRSRRAPPHRGLWAFGSTADNGPVPASVQLARAHGGETCTRIVVRPCC